ncbi:MAG: 1-acyl-sn-glycerol-3-phosphate acyltransferase [Peptococcaceae bacterium]|nr:1-acyl-sn-glycerol-3-phosphate acyltransferase [Peptococcaceae bacterium]
MFYNLARVLCRLVLLLLRRWEVSGSGNMPSSGGVVVVANHVSYWDPVVVGCAFNRKIHYMAKAELFKITFLGPVITALGAFPVHRDRTDRAAIRTAVTHLQEGRVIGVFPEGTRSKTGELLKPHLGAAMLAQKAGTPILPVALKGTRGVFGKVTVWVGEPLHIGAGGGKTGRAELEEASERAMTVISSYLLRSRH